MLRTMRKIQVFTVLATLMACSQASTPLAGVPHVMVERCAPFDTNEVIDIQELDDEIVLDIGVDLHCELQDDGSYDCPSFREGSSRFAYVLVPAGEEAYAVQSGACRGLLVERGSDAEQAWEALKQAGEDGLELVGDILIGLGFTAFAVVYLIGMGLGLWGTLF